MNDADRALRSLLLLALAAVAWLIRPFFDALLIAVVVAILVWPAHAWIVRRVGGRRVVGTGFTLTALTVGIVGPTAGLFVLVSGELVQLVNRVSDRVQDGSLNAWLYGALQSRPVAWITDSMGGPGALADALRGAAQDAALTVAGAVSQNVPDLVGITGLALLKVVVFYLAIGTLLHQGEGLGPWVTRVSPLQPEHTKRLYEVFAEFARNVVLAGIVAGMLQGVVAGVGYGFAGVGRAWLFALLTGVLAYVPFIGTALVWVPLTVLLIAEGRYGAATFLVAWSILLTGTVDNLVKPLIVRGRTSVPAVLVFVGVFGGLAAFGLIGVLVGPVLIAMLLALVQIYTERRAELGGQDDPRLPSS